MGTNLFDNPSDIEIRKKMKSTIAVCLVVLMLSAVVIDAQFYPGYYSPYYGGGFGGGFGRGPFGGRWGGGRGLAALGAGALLFGGATPLVRGIGGIGLASLIG